MRRIQFSLTVSEGKWLIAHAIADMKEVRDAIAGGRIVLKGGTTVSCVSELPERRSGYADVSPNAARFHRSSQTAPSTA